MKKTYIAPIIECEEMIGDELLQTMSQYSTKNATQPAYGKERETINFADEIEW